MAGPGDEITPGVESRGQLRAAHADREQVIGTLKAAFVQGMLDKDEFDQRAGQTFGSRTYAELAALTADLPAGVAAARPARMPARLITARPLQPPRDSANKKKKAVAALSCATLAYPGLVAALPPIPDGSPVAAPVAVVLFVLFGALATGWLLLLHAWFDERAGRKSAQGRPPGAGGQASQRSVPADPAGQLPQARRGPRQAGVRNPGETVSRRRGRSNHIRPGGGRMAGEAAVPLMR
jgi:Domain of unknown function (DUF1707)